MWCKTVKRLRRSKLRWGEKEGVEDLKVEEHEKEREKEEGEKDEDDEMEGEVEED